MIELCYFSLDQWEIRIHLLWGICFNIPHHCDPHLNQTKFNDLLSLTIHGPLAMIFWILYTGDWTLSFIECYWTGSPQLWLWPFLRLLLRPSSFVRFSTLPVEICFYIYLLVCCHYKVSKSTWANMILSKYDLIYLILLVLIIKWGRQ